MESKRTEVPDKASSRSSKSKSADVIVSPPSELCFKIPNDTKAEMTTILKITNGSMQSYYFKVKTTAPKSYCVRPNSGILLPKETKEIHVMIQPPFPERDQKSKDKFLVQTLLAEDPILAEPNELWKVAEKDKTNYKIVECKLKCIWDFDEGGVVKGPSTGKATESETVIAAPPDRTSATDRSIDPVRPSVKESSPVVAAPPAAAALPRTKSVPAAATAADTASKTGESWPASEGVNPGQALRRKPSLPNVAAPPSARPATAAAAAATGPPVSKHDIPSLLLLLFVFILGYIFGKFVL